MAIDAIFISLLAEELREKLMGAKIEKIQQPDKGRVVIVLRRDGVSRKLLIAAGSGNCRLHLTEAQTENPANPPAFCMLMRKHLSSGRLIAIEQPGNDRILVFRISAYDEMGYAVEKRLVAELMGKNANLILVGSDGRIVDSLYRRDFNEKSMRAVQPGMIYRLPEAQDRPNVLDPELSPAELLGGKDNADRILKTYAGICPLAAREIAFAGGDSDAALNEALFDFVGRVFSSECGPYMLVENGRPADIFYLPVFSAGADVKSIRYESFCELLDTFYSRREAEICSTTGARELRHKVNTVYNRIRRKVEAQREEYARCEKREELRKKAELITANIWQLKKGMTGFECEDYYTDPPERIYIELDPLKTPQMNSASLFKQYNKLKTASDILCRMIAEEEEQLNYLESVLDELTRVEGESDAAAISLELYEQGFLKKQEVSKAAASRKMPPRKVLSKDGFEILIGRNNKQNDELTFSAGREDIWLHVKNIHGSHVIIRSAGSEIPPSTIEQAAELAAFYSQGRGSGKVAVDYTEARNVKKPNGSAPGKVIYVKYHTIIANSVE